MKMIVFYFFQKGNSVSFANQTIFASRRMAVLKQIPNTLTLINLFGGCVGIVFVSMGYFRLASACIIVSAILDFFDGVVARTFKANSATGKELDSLADIVTFGVLPSFMVFSFLIKIDEVAMITSADLGLPFRPLYLVAFIMAVFSALRLARFNLDPGQEYSFRGLPTPANGLFWASVFLGLGSSGCLQADASLFKPDYSSLRYAVTSTNCSVWTDLLLNKYFVLLLSVVMAFLLIAPLRLLSFKLKGWSWNENKYRYQLVIFSILAGIMLGFEAAPIILLLYMVFSFFAYRKSFLS